MKSFLQTTEWLEFQKEIGHKVWRFDNGKITANIIKHDLPFGKSYLYIPHGPEADLNMISGGLKNEFSNFISYLKELARNESAIFIKIEPLSDSIMELLYAKEMKRSTKQIQPYRTVVIDLALPEEHLRGRMHQKTRYNINLSEKKELKLEESNDIGVFLKLLKQTAKKDQFSIHPKEYYEEMLKFFKNGELKTKLFLVKLDNGTPIAGSIVMTYQNTAYYLHGAMDRDYKNLMAPYFMHWEIIKKLKNDGCKYYDLWGIDGKKWPGVTRFKLGWLGSLASPKPTAERGLKPDEGAGGLKEYPGSFDLIVDRSWYFIYNLARKII